MSNKNKSNSKQSYLVNLPDDYFPTFRTDFMTTFDEMVDDFLNNMSTSQFKPISSGYPKFNISEYNNYYEIEATVPGLKKNEINIIIDDNMILKVSGHKVKNDKEIKKANYCKEIRMSKFSRSIRLPKDANIEDISSNLDKGILEIKIPKIYDDDKKKYKKVKIE